MTRHPVGRPLPVFDYTSDPRLSVVARRFGSIRDKTRVLALTVADLVLAIKNEDVRTIDLAGNTTYLLGDNLTISRTSPLRIVGAPGAVIDRYSDAISPVISHESGMLYIELVELRVPLVSMATMSLRDVTMASPYPGDLLGQCELHGASSVAIGCRGPTGATPCGIVVAATAIGTCVLGCDFGAHATGFLVASAAGAHLGPDANNGVVVTI